jgi:hypothetical protein
MATVYELTIHDGKTKVFNAKFFYSNVVAAKKSYESLKSYYMRKHGLTDEDVEKWNYSHGGANRTEILAGRWNLSVIPHTLSKEVSVFINPQEN